MKLSKKTSALIAVICCVLALLCVAVIIYDMCQPLGGAGGGRTLRARAIILSVAGFAALTPASLFFLCRALPDDKSRAILRVFVVLFGAVGLACGLYLVIFFLVPSVHIRLRTFFLCIFGVVYFTFATIIAACESIRDDKMKKTVVKVTLIASFAVYVVMFYGFLIVFRIFSEGRSFVFRYHKDWLRDAMPYMVPIKHTIRKFAASFAMKRGLFRTVGSFLVSALAYTPLAFFLPALFKGQRRFDSFLTTIIFVVIATEFFQAMFGLGACKIDDFIFGAGFACLAFYILRRPAIIKRMNARHIYL